MEGCTFFCATSAYCATLRSDFLGDLIAITTTIAAIIIQGGLITPVQVMRLIGFVFKTVEKLAHPKCTDDAKARQADFDALAGQVGLDVAFNFANWTNAAGMLKDG